MISPKVSVIVTIHNAEDYIENCIESVCNQTFREIEILCIDGGSSDSTPEILKKMSEKDNRIIIINDKNASYGHKINVGMNAAKGKYISILESDDCYVEDMLGTLYNVAEQTGVDFVDGDLYRFFEYRGREIGSHDDKYIDKKFYGRIIEDNWENEIIFCPGAIYTALYRKDFLKDNCIRMHESPGASYQDVGFAFQTHAYATSTYHVNKPVYKYRQDNNASSIYNCKKIFEIADEFAFIKAEFESKQVNNEKIWKQFYITKYGCYQDRMNFMVAEGRELFLERLFVELEEDVHNGNVTIAELVSLYGLELYGNYPDKKKILEVFFSKEQDVLPQRVSRLLDETGEKKLVICSMGKYGKEALCYLKQIEQCEIAGICDNSQELIGTQIQGVTVIKVAQAVCRNAEAYFLIANKKNRERIKKQLSDLGIKEEKMFFYNG